MHGGPLAVVDQSGVSPSDLDAVAPRSFNPAVALDRAGMLAEGAIDSHEITLTFDDGPGAGTTPEVLRILAAHHVRATFFLTGQRLEGSSVVAEVNRGIARAIVLAGHIVGNHALDHIPLDNRAECPPEGPPKFAPCASFATAEKPFLRPPMTTPAWPAWNESADGRQIVESAQLIEAATGVSPHYFRPPYGTLAASARLSLSMRGDELVMWTIDSQDHRETSPEHLAKRLIAQILFAGQGVVLLHDLHPTSVRALSLLLDWLDSHRAASETREDDPASSKPSYTVVDLPTYLSHAAARPYPYSTRLQLLQAREQWHGLLPRSKESSADTATRAPQKASDRRKGSAEITMRAPRPRTQS
ncbi:MAG: hypothetical protein NVSMB1_25270 [Polyangiales bacterium]